jgi:hypothetical protein
MTCNFCHGVNQGRVCEACLNATRAAMFFPPMHIEDGGHTFNHGVVFPIEDEDDPATTPSTASGWLIYAAIAALFLVFTLFVVRLGVPNL